jgi:hypothetical protein
MTTSSRPSRLRRLVCALLGAGALIAFSAPASADALAGAASAPATTPTIAVPASAVPATGGVAASPAGSTATTVTPPPATATQTSTAPAASVSGAARATTGAQAVVVHRTTSPSRLSNTAIAAAALAALIALCCLVWGVARMLAYEPRWTLSLRHTLAEAGFRASATWAEFGDWIRLGR